MTGFWSSSPPQHRAFSRVSQHQRRRSRSLAFRRRDCPNLAREHSRKDYVQFSGQQSLSKSNPLTIQSLPGQGPSIRLAAALCRVVLPSDSRLVLPPAAPPCALGKPVSARCCVALRQSTTHMPDRFARRRTYRHMDITARGSEAKRHPHLSPCTVLHWARGAYNLTRFSLLGWGNA
jgi:hypothetical protein